MILKKGDTSNLSNYTPIALLNSLYKIFASILQQRIAEQIDDRLQKHSTDLGKTKAPLRQYTS